MTRSAILTTQACDDALSLITPALEANLSADGAFGGPNGELIVLNPTTTLEPTGGVQGSDFEDDVILWRHQFGDVPNWPFDYGTFARAKAYLSLKHRLPADLVIASYPYLLEPGFAKYGGSAVDPVGGLVVAFSGAAPHHDKFVSELMIAAIRLICEERMQSVIADPDLHLLVADD